MLRHKWPRSPASYARPWGIPGSRADGRQKDPVPPPVLHWGLGIKFLETRGTGAWIASHLYLAAHAQQAVGTPLLAKAALSTDLSPLLMELSDQLSRKRVAFPPEQNGDHQGTRTPALAEAGV